MDLLGLHVTPWFQDIDGLHHPLILDFERTFFDKTYANFIGDLMNQWWWTSIVIAILYIALIFSGQTWMKTRERFELRRLLILWNAFLALFSIYGMIRCVPEMLHNLNKEGLEYTICNRDNIYGITGFWITIFCWSKVPELIDTVFIVLRKQKLIFLHWFHHATVMIYAWYSYHNWTASGRWFVFMNYTVHAMMYSYYAFRAMKYRIPKWIQISITICQLLQMAVGCFVNYKAYTYKQTGAPCDVTYSNIGWSFAMYAVYFGLFLNFFYIAYFPKKKRAESTLKVQEQNDEKKDYQTKQIVNNESCKNGIFSQQIIPFGILMALMLIFQNMIHSLLPDSKYISWSIYAFLLLAYVRLQRVSAAKMSFPFNCFSRKESQ